MKNCEATSIISNNNPGMLIAEKTHKKETVFCLKCPGLGAYDKKRSSSSKVERGSFL
jgi:hypothetical protein